MKSCTFLIISLIVILLLTQISLRSENSQKIYCGQQPPGMTPVIFAPGFISLDNRFEYGIAFSPDGKECVFGVTDTAWSTCNLFYTKMEGDKWIEPVQAPFQGNGDGWTPWFSLDGLSVMFASGRPDFQSANLYISTKTKSGWSSPEKVGDKINTPAFEWKPSMSESGEFYYCSNYGDTLGYYDIYRATFTPEGDTVVENIGSPINTITVDASPFIAMDGSYLIYETWKKEGFGQADIYISFRNEDGSWSEGINAGDKINTAQIDDAGFVTADGKYFFFCRREQWVTQTQSDFYWVDMQVLLQLKDDK